MEQKTQLSGIAALQKAEDFFHPGFSVDCVVLGFHNGNLKILLTRYKGFDKWRLPGSFVFKDEDVDAAAFRILKERTGLDNVFLKQFYLFGNSDRNRKYEQRVSDVLKELYQIDLPEDHWYNRRIMTLGYYALVEYSKVRLPERGYEGEFIEWHDLDHTEPMYADHSDIVKKALEMIRLNLNVLPLGKELLSEKFTLPELRVIYETILGNSLDRRNFQRKILSFGYIEKLNEQRKGGSHKAPNLYKFDTEKYEKAMQQGFD